MVEFSCRVFKSKWSSSEGMSCVCAMVNYSYKCGPPSGMAFASPSEEAVLSQVIGTVALPGSKSQSPGCELSGGEYPFESRCTSVDKAGLIESYRAE